VGAIRRRRRRERERERAGEARTKTRRRAMATGTRVLVNEGTKGCVRGYCAASFFAVISNHRFGCCYGARHFEARQ
jgi:hypothetical protein